MMASCWLCCVLCVFVLALGSSSNGHLEDLDLNPKFNPLKTSSRTNAEKGPTDTGLPDGKLSDGSERTQDQLKEHVMDIRMPGVRPRKEDAYLCTSAPVADETQYITNLEALASANQAHHLLVFGCAEAFSTRTWECGRICKGNEVSKIIYAWARNAPPTKMPPDVGFKIGKESGLKTLVLQIHYKHRMSPDQPDDYSGTRLTLTKERQNYLAGILILMRLDLVIPPHTKGVHGDVSCTYNGEAPLYPFLFRVHAHELSSVISAYHYNGSFSLLGKGNPKWPEAFYPMAERHEIMPGDKLFARCTYDSTDRDQPTHMGGNHDDEMCNFYMMYYMSSNKSEPYFQCVENEFPDLSEKMPAGSDIPPPPNRELEEQGDPQPQGVTLAEGWPLISPEDNLTLGQIGGVGTDSIGNIYVFHRGRRKWEGISFDKNNKFRQGPIKENTVVTFNAQGKVIKQWGGNFFYMPHGLHIDNKDNIWLTDVGLHQVFRYKSGSSTPDLVLGEKLVPGNDKHHFCKPTDVAVLKSGEFFVSDGYCNNRVIKYTNDGKWIKEWGSTTKNVESDGYPPPNAFDIPHSLALIESRGWLCVADRENGRIQVFSIDGKFIKQIHPEAFKKRLFAVSYSPTTDFLYAVNGPGLYNENYPVKGFTIHPDTGTLLETWAPSNGFQNPHDLEVSLQGDFIYVGELDPHKVWRMYIHKEIVEAQKRKKGLMTHPESVDGGKTSLNIDDGEENDLGASMVIGALLVIPVIFIVAVTLFLRLRKNGKFSFLTKMMYRRNRNRRFNLGNLLSQKKGFSRLDTDAASDQELDHLNSDSDVEEYSATTRKA